MKHSLLNLNIYKNIEPLLAAENIRALNQRLAEILLSLGIKTYSYSSYSYHPRSKQKLKYEYCSNNFKKWHDYYLSEKYEEIDTTLHACYLAVEPFVWILTDQLEQAKTPRERQMRMDGIKFGAHGGISVPIHGPNNDFATLTLIEMQGDHFLKDAQQLMPLLLLMSQYYYGTLFRLLPHEKNVGKTLLTEREISCLNLHAHHFSVADIAKKLNITPRTVHFHLQNVNKKLGVSNKFEAVNKAIEMNIIVQ